MVALSVSRRHAQRSSAPMRAHTHTHTQTRTHTSEHTPNSIVNIKPQNEYLNMNSACLCVNEWEVVFTTRTEARVT